MNDTQKEIVWEIRRLEKRIENLENKLVELITKI